MGYNTVGTVQTTTATSYDFYDPVQLGATYDYNGNVTGLAANMGGNGMRSPKGRQVAQRRATPW